MIRIGVFVALLLVPTLAAAQQDQTVVNRVLGNVPELVTAATDPELAAGSIRVLVVDASEAPVAGQPRTSTSS